MGTVGWEMVEEVFNTARPDEIPSRDLDSLKNKYRQMCKHKKPTGVYCGIVDVSC